MMTNPSRGMILDRGLTPDLLDIALRVATDATPRAEADLPVLAVPYQGYTPRTLKIRMKASV